MSRRVRRLVDLALLVAVLLAPAERRRVGVGDRGIRQASESTTRFQPSASLSFVAHAAHVDAGAGNAGGFGGDLGDEPELGETRTIGPDPNTAIPAVITQFKDQQGVVAVGMVEELLRELNSAFCDASRVGGRAYACLEFENARERLWMTFANEYVCGGLDAVIWATQPRAVMHLSVQEQFEFLLAACDTRWVGDLVVVVREATVLFLAQSTLNRVDIKATVVENDRKAQRSDTLPTDNLYELHPGFYEDLAPASTGVREPAVATWKVEPDLDGYGLGFFPNPNTVYGPWTTSTSR